MKEDIILESPRELYYNDAVSEIARLFGNNTIEISNITKVGSRVTCSPPPLDTDEDFLILVKSGEKFEKEVADLYYIKGGSDIPHEDNILSSEDRFMSFVKVIDGVCVNLIVTESLIFFDRFMIATHVSTKLNLMNKEQRIMLFQAILYGNKV